MTTLDIQQAREWAKYATRIGTSRNDARAAIDLIESLPDQWVDAEKLREVVSKYEGNTYISEIVQDFADLLPAPKPRTMADMSFEELKDYIGEKVTVDGCANPSRLVAVIGDEGAVLVHRWNKPWPFVEVHPLSDLAPVAAHEQEAGSTLEPVQPRPEDVPPGEPWSIRYWGKEWVGVRSDHVMEPWSIISMDGMDYRDVDDSEITLMFRLVPERKENA